MITQQHFDSFLGKPVSATAMPPEYIEHFTSMLYLWAWPMVNVHNRVAQFRDIPAAFYMNGIAPVAPVNHLCMLTDYIKPQQKAVACPNQDVVYGIGALDLSIEPVIIQVPDFGDRFWIYQVCDERTDSFGSIGKPHGTEPGFYLLAGAEWNGTWPKGVSGMFICPTQLGIVMPRIFQWDEPQDRAAIQPLLNQIMMYPLSQFDGQMKTTDWLRTPAITREISGGKQETAWVRPEVFFDQLPQLLKEVPPMPGEEAIYAQVSAFLAALQTQPELKKIAVQHAIAAEAKLISPLFNFINVGYPARNNWTTQNNGARFGIDYLTRAACAKSNIFVNQPEETKYFYLDLDADGMRLNGKNAYTVTFPKNNLPPVKGFWSLTVYNKEHFFEPNKIDRYSIGTKNNKLQITGDDLTIYIQHEAPEAQYMHNWLPAPEGEFSLYLRCYWPRENVLADRWAPAPAIRRS
jgi:hypothetical protein